MQVPNPAPYISVIVTARNDNHGVNMLGRMQAFLDSWILQAQRYNLPSEIIVVEWNPPADRPPLKDALRWQESTAPCSVRFITVPREVHQSIPFASAIPLHQMIAKNVGIRRAQGEFLLLTNIDIIFSAELMQFLAARTLNPGVMYRMDRLDVASDIPENNLDELLGFCQRRITRVCAREGVWDTSDPLLLRPVETRDVAAADSGIRLGTGWYGVEVTHDAPFRYIDADAEIYFDRPPGVAAQLMLDVEVGPSAPDGWLDLDVLDAEGNEVASALIEGRGKVRLKFPDGLQSGKLRLRTRGGGVALLEDPRMLDLRVFGIAWPAAGTRVIERPRPGAPEWKLDVLSRPPATKWNCQNPYAPQMRNPVYLHTNGCGDFTLLSRKNWFGLRGYAEFPIWPTHIDALICYAAHHAGIPEVVLKDPLRVFHVEHATVWTPQTEEERKLRAAERGVPMYPYSVFMEHVNYMRRFHVPLIFAGSNWGLSSQSLPEATV